MLIFISTYVLLALASWSALAAPLSGRDNAQKDSSSSSILMGRQTPEFFNGLGPVIIPISSDGSSSSTMDCDSKPKSKSKSDSKSDSNDATTTVNSYPSMTSTGPGPAVARRHFRNPMRRDSNNAPSIFERDDVPTTSSSNKPITVGDVVASYLQQRAASRKRAERPKTSRGYN